MKITLIDLDNALLTLIFVKLKFSSARDYRSLALTCKRFTPIVKPGIHRKLNRWDVFGASASNDLDMLGWLKSHRIFYVSECVIGAFYAKDFDRALETLKRIKTNHFNDDILNIGLQKKVPDEIIAYLLQTNIRDRRLVRATLFKRPEIWKIVPGNPTGRIITPKKDRLKLKELGEVYLKREYPNLASEVVVKIIKEWETSDINGIRRDLDMIVGKIMDEQ